MKLTYKLGDNNQLVIIKDKIILKPRGKFSLNSSNQLVYEINESASWLKAGKIPKKITFKGKWQLDSKHNLIYSLRKSSTQAGRECLLLKTELVAAEAKSLTFSLGTKEESGIQNIRLLQLKGKWQVDKHNRLQFVVKQSSDTITLRGDWQVKNNSLIYTYRESKLKRIHSLRFKGYWQINKPNRLTYVLDSQSDSAFSFKVYLETPSLIGKKGVIKYRVGLGLKKSKIITLYGIWKFERKSGLSLEIDYGQGRIEKINFGAFVRIRNKNKISFKLVSKEGKNLGIKVEFSRTFLENRAKWFSSGLKDERELRLEAGVAIPW